ncbi:MAG: site-specific integrase [Prevotella sp.]|nr:site-specific integrase [Prevotella sp.]
MTTIKVKFRPSTVTNQEGTLYYQVIHHRAVRWISTGYHLFRQEWNEKEGAVILPKDQTHEDRRVHLQFVRSRVEGEQRQIREVVRQKEESGVPYNLDDLIEAFRKLPPVQTVFSFIQAQIAKKSQMKRIGTTKTYTDALRRFREFREGEDLDFESMTTDLMERYEAWLIDRGLKRNSIAYYLRTLRTLYNRAVEAGLTDDHDIFRHVHTSYGKTTKRAVSVSDIRAIERIDLREGSSLAFARDLFMFSFYMRGMPFVDMAFLRKNDLKRGLVTYCRKKTNQSLTIAWEKPMQDIVDRYTSRTRNTPFMLPILKQDDDTVYRRYRQVEQTVNRNLKKIGDRIGLRIPLTTYVARHSWASIARNMDVSIAVISEGMGHNSYRTTQIYLNSIDTSQINRANRKIIRNVRRKC